MPTDTISPSMPQLTLYTNHTSPYAYRAHIALTMLDLPFSEVEIPLDTPRDEWYLEEINPRGLIPALKVRTPKGKENVIIESGIIVNFLLDLAISLRGPYAEIASAITAPPKGVDQSLQKARGAILIDVFETKVVPTAFQFLGFSPFPDGEDEISMTEKYIQTFSDEVEPLVQDTTPFFGNSPKLTYVEIMLGGFILKLFEYIDYGLIPRKVGRGVKDVCPKFYDWAQTVRVNETVKAGIYPWDEQMAAEDFFGLPSVPL